MKFMSNADMAHHYAMELLVDGQPHSLKEIIDFTMEQTGNVGVSGEPLTRSMVYSSIRHRAALDGAPYTRTFRGMYQLVEEEALLQLSAVPEPSDPLLAMTEQTEMAIDAAQKHIQQAYTLNLATCDFTEDELLQIKSTGEQIRDLLSQAKLTASLLYDCITFERQETEQGFSEEQTM